MTALQQHNEFEEWPTLAEAAEQLTTTERSIQRRIAAQEIEARPRHRPGRRPETVCNPRDIERLKPTAHVMPADSGSRRELARLTPPAPAPPQPEAQALAPLLAALAATIGAGQHSEALDMNRRWLTLEEASGHTGLSSNFLRRQKKAGKVTAVRDGREWKYDRQSLDNFTPGIASEKPSGQEE